MGRFGAYLRTAFLNRWNLLFVGAGVAAALIAGFPGVILPLVAAGELYYLSSMLTNRGSAPPSRRRTRRPGGPRRRPGPGPPTSGSARGCPSRCSTGSTSSATTA
jgi:hypothetical protein